MAIDPVTAKILAQVATKVVTDEETRNKVLYIILISVTISVFILLIPLYLLTHPFEMLKAAFVDTPSDAAFIEQYKRENDDKFLVFGENLVLQDTYPLPVKNANVTSEYGERIDPITGQSAFHHGTDFSGAWQSEIYAIADGEVVDIITKKNNDYGNYIIIRHKGQRTNNAGGIETDIFYALYGHMNEIYMFKGQLIKQGAVIGLMGGDPERDTNPGRSTGTHLHFEIRLSQNGSAVSPNGYIFPVPEPKVNKNMENEDTTNE